MLTKISPATSEMREWKSGFTVLHKLRLHDAICRLRLCTNSFIHILSLSNSHNNVASIQKNRDDKSHRVIVAIVGKKNDDQNIKGV